MNDLSTTIRETVLRHYPAAQAVYLFGSHADHTACPDSDVDIALLLPPAEAATVGELMLSACQAALVMALSCEVDLVNMRRVSTVLQKEILANGDVLLKHDEYAVDEFEMLVFSYYQKLNEERAAILDDFARTGRAYNV